MSFDRDRHSIISSSQSSQASSVNPPNPNRNYNKPLINSAVTSNDMSDEEIARQQQERLYRESLMDVDEPSAAAATSFDTRPLDEIEADAAIARQLQEDEYSRNSMVPTRPYQREPYNNKSPPIAINPFGEPVTTDAEFAAQLQAEENNKQRRQRHRPPVPSQRRTSQPTTNEDDESDVIPIPFLPIPTPQRPPSSGHNNRNNNDFASLLQLFGSRGRPFRGSHRPNGRRIQNNNEDFGPDDYENLLELDNAVGKTSLTPEQIDRLPTEKFQRQANKTAEDNKCHVCWDQFEQNQTLRRLRCLHLYHKDCIDPWLKKNNACPICRMPPIE